MTFEITLDIEFLAKNAKDGAKLRDNLISKGVNFVVFQIALDQKFPFSAPQVFCVSELGLHFELNDGREIFEAIMKRKWCSLILIQGILMEIPDFISSLYSFSPALLRQVGGYTPGSMYEFEQLALNDFIHVAYCHSHLRDTDTYSEA